MCTRVCDIFEMRILKKSRLLAGKGGLNNIVTGVNIYEYMLKRTHDRTGELYLTSFYNIREGGNDALLEHIEILINTNCPGLILGEGVYAQISDEIILLADKHNFPIIGMGENVIYSEILESAYNLILGSTSIDNSSILFDRMMMIQDRDIILKYAKKLNENFRDYYCVLYIACYQNNSMAYQLLDGRLGFKNQHTIIKYKEGYVVIISSKHENINDEKVLDKVISKLGSNNIEYHIGVSETYSDYRDLKKATIEAKYAYITGEKITKHRVEKVSQIGMYRMLIPICKDEAVVEYSRSIVNKVREYDEKYNMEILDTVLVYLECNYDIMKTANKLFLHKNTIRYRLKKIESIIDNSIHDSIEQLSVAVRVLKLNDEL